MLMFVLNVSFVLIEFAKYSTKSRVAPYTPLEQVVPRTSLCFPTLFLHREHRSRQGKSFFAINAGATLNRKVDQLFDSTPRAESIIKLCQYRRFDLDVMWFERNVSLCNKFFNVQRYRMYGYMCYLFTPNYTKPYMMHSVTYSIDRERHLYKLTLNKPFSEGLRLLPLIHFDDLPDDEIIFNQEVLTSIESEEFYTLSYNLYESIRLPAPYDTNCNPKSPIVCYRNCMESHYRKEGFTIVGGINVEFETPGELVIPDYSNETYGHIINRVYRTNNENCVDKCMQERCINKLVATFTSTASPAKEKLSFIVETAKNPVTKMKYVPKFDFMDMVIHITSVAGIWIGFSVVSILAIRRRVRSIAYDSLISKLYARARALEMFKLRRAYRMKVTCDEFIVSRERKKKRKDRLKLRTLKCAFAVYRAAVLAAFFDQMFKVTKSYLAFETQMQITADLNPKLNFPSITVCLLLSDLKPAVNTYQEVNHENYDQELMKAYAYQNLTTAQIIQEAMPVSQLIAGCRIRNHSKHFSEMEQMETSFCMKKFHVEMFLRSKQLCYMFVPRLESDPNIRTRTQSSFRSVLNSPGIMYSLILNPIVAKFLTVNVAASSGHAYPFTSILYAASSFRRYVNKMQLVSYQLSFKSSLPPPYDTRCSLNTEDTCIENCYENCFIRHVGRVPFNYLIIHGSDKRFLSYSDLRNRTIYDLYVSCNKKCSGCYQQLCDYNFTKTYLSSYFRSNNTIEFVMDLPVHPHSHSKAEPVVSLYDFYYQIFCSLSFWLGFTFFNVNPWQWYLKFKDRKVNRLLEDKINSVDKLIARLKLCIDAINNSVDSQTEKQSIEMKKLLANNLVAKKVFVYTLCAFGCTFFLYSSLSEYLTYSTDIQTESVPENLIPYNVSICFPLEELFAEPKLMSNEKYYEFKSNLFDRTIEQFYNETPLPESMVSGCGYRGIEVKDPPDSPLNFKDGIFYMETNKSLCRSIFSIEKYFLKSYVCYKFSRKNFRSIDRSLRNLLIEVNWEDEQYMIAVKKKWLTRRFLFSVHSNYPFLSAYWSSPIFKKKFNRWYAISYIRYDMEILPPPYTKDGFDDLFFNRCFDNCINNKLRPLNKSQATLFIRPKAVKLIVTRDWQNATFSRMMSQLSQICRVRCEKSPFIADRVITYTYIVTVLNEEAASESYMNNSTTFWLKKTDYPVIKVEFRPHLSFFQLIINIGSTLSIWFGISPMSSYIEKMKGNSKCNIGKIENMWRTLDSLEYRSMMWQRPLAK